MSKRALPAWMGLGLILGWTACASAPPPRDAIGRARAALDSAEKSGAASDAPLEVRKARDELARAENALREERNEEARRAAEKAEVEAVLAATEARKARGEREFKDISQTVRALEKEVRRDNP
jgi:hypothetical protein